MPEVNHGPLPWQLSPYSTSRTEHVADATGAMVADCCRGTREFGTANAALIVEAVNHHIRLVLAVKVALKVFRDLRRVLVNFVTPDRNVESLDAVIKNLEAVLPPEKEAA